MSLKSTCFGLLKQVTASQQVNRIRLAVQPDRLPAPRPAAWPGSPLRGETEDHSRRLFDPALRLQVLERDGQCVLAKLSPSHQCRDQWGTPHRSDELGRLTLDHSKDALRLGRRGPSDLSHLTAMCWAGNVGVPSKASRELIRAYLLEVAG